MTELILAISKGTVAFIVTNIDDILILTLFFTQVNVTFRRRQIVLGQYLGFTVLLLASLSGFFGSLLVPPSWIKWLGIVPVFLGIEYLLGSEDNDAHSVQKEQRNITFQSRWLSSQTYAVAMVTVANGGDNLGVYVPLFANSTWQSLLTILITFWLLIGVWCFLAYKLTRFPAIARLLTNYGSILVPCVLISLGIFIVKENTWLALITLVVSYLWAISISQDSAFEGE